LEQLGISLNRSKSARVERSIFKHFCRFDPTFITRQIISLRFGKVTVLSEREIAATLFAIFGTVLRKNVDLISFSSTDRAWSFSVFMISRGLNPERNFR